jgi:hypothetical protein
MKGSPTKRSYLLGTALIAVAPILVAVGLLSPRSLASDLRDMLSLLIRK